MMSKVNSKVAYMLQKFKDAWQPLKEIPIYYQLVNELVRFKLIPAGRRSGKTEKFKRYLVTRSLYEAGKMFFVGAPTRTRVKTLYWNDLLAKIPPGMLDERGTTKGAELKIRLKNETEIHLLSMDNPKVIEGAPWDGGGFDEWDDIASAHPECWDENIRPALSNASKKPWCWIFGVPGGLNYYYKMVQRVLTEHPKDWAVYTWHSSEVLSADEIEDAMRTLSPRAFRQEYQASFESAGNRIYEDYSHLNHTDWDYNPVLPIIWCHDFNYSPLSSCICQEHNGKIYAVDEIVLESAIARQSAEEFCNRYKDYKRARIIIYGDMSGHAGEKHGHISNYMEIVQILKQNGFYNVELRVPRDNPALKTRHNEVRAKILNALGMRTLFVNPKKCPTLDDGFFTAQFKKGSTELEDDKNPSQHITTAIGYFIAYEQAPVDAGRMKIR